MNTHYIIPKNTPVITIRADKPWMPPNFVLIQTTQTNIFKPCDLVVAPYSRNVQHCAQYAQAVGSLYASIGYYAFRKHNYICITPTEHVFIHNNETTPFTQDKDRTHENHNHA